MTYLAKIEACAMHLVESSLDTKPVLLRNIIRVSSNSIYEGARCMRPAVGGGQEDRRKQCGICGGRK